MTDKDLLRMQEAIFKIGVKAVHQERLFMQVVEPHLDHEQDFHMFAYNNCVINFSYNETINILARGIDKLFHETSSKTVPT